MWHPQCFGATPTCPGACAWHLGISVTQTHSCYSRSPLTTPQLHLALPGLQQHHLTKPPSISDSGSFQVEEGRGLLNKNHEVVWYINKYDSLSFKTHFHFIPYKIMNFIMFTKMKLINRALACLTNPYLIIRPISKPPP